MTDREQREKQIEEIYYALDNFGEKRFNELHSMLTDEIRREENNSNSMYYDKLIQTLEKEGQTYINSRRKAPKSGSTSAYSHFVSEFRSDLLIGKRIYKNYSEKPSD